MKINEIYIDNFGELSNFSLNIKNGFNLFHCSEETKESIINFIKMVFYGSPNNENENNPRIKFRPKNSTKMSGSIDFEFKDQKFMIERNFGSSNNADKISILNITTGVSEKLSPNVKIGEKFFNVTAAAFNRTVFITTPELFLNQKSKKEISTMLSNIITTTNENISQENVYNNLNNFKNSLSSEKTHQGLLDEKQKLYSALEEELENARKEEHEKFQMQKECQKLFNRKQKIFNELNRVKYQIEVKEKLEKLKSFDELAIKQKEYDEYKKLLIEKIQLLKTDSITVNNSYIEKCKNILNELDEKDKKLENLFEAQKRIKREIQEFAPQHESSIQSVYELDAQLDQAQAAFDLLKKDYFSTNKNLIAASEELKEAEVSFQLITQKIDSLEDLSKQKLLFAEEQLRRSSEKKAKENTKKSDMHIIYVSIILILLCLFSIPFIGNLMFVPIGIAIFVGIYAILKKRATVVTYEYIDQNAIVKAQEHLLKTRNLIDQENSIFTKNKKDSKVTYENAKRNKDELETKLNKLKNKYDQYERNIAFLQKQKSIEESSVCVENPKYNVSKQDYIKVKNSIKSIETEKKSLISEFIELISQFKKVETYIEATDCYNYLKGIIKEISLINQKLKEFDHKEESKSNSYELQVSRLKEEIDKHQDIVDTIGNDQTLNELNQIYNNLNIRFKKEENAYIQLNAKLKLKYKNSKSIICIEREIENLHLEIVELKKAIVYTDIAIQIFEEASEEMFNKYSPTINKKAELFLSELTSNKYAKISVSNNLNVSIRNLKNKSLALKYLNSGTYDQAYFALKLAVSNIMIKRDFFMPIVLDDIFLQYDENRTLQGFKFLEKYSIQSQIIMFTCHNHLVELAKKESLDIVIKKIK